MMKQSALLVMLILLCAATAFPQLERKVTALIYREIVKQMIADSAFTSECVREAGGATKAVTIEQEDLNRDGKPEFFVVGKSCGLGPRRADAWYYRKTGNSYEQILYVNQIEDIRKLKTRTKGYVNLKVTSSIGRDTFGAYTYKFDGRRYREQ